MKTRALWIAPPLLALAALFFYPLFLIATTALSGSQHEISLAGFTHVAESKAFREALLHTVQIAAVASAGCVVLGFTIALILFYAPFPGSRVVARVIDTFIALPTFLVALAFTFIYGSAGMVNGTLMGTLHLEKPPVDFLYSFWGVVLAEVTVYTPFVIRPLLAAFSVIDPSHIEVASSLGARPWRIVREIVAPAALPALLAGGSLCLLLTVNEFGIVLFIGGKGVTTLPLLVYDKAIQEFDYTSACAIAAVNLGVSLCLFSIYRFVLGRFARSGAGVQ